MKKNGQKKISSNLNTNRKPPGKEQVHAKTYLRQDKLRQICIGECEERRRAKKLSERTGKKLIFFRERKCERIVKSGMLNILKAILK